MNLTEEQQEESCVESNFSCSGTSLTVADVLIYTSVAVVVTVTVCGNLLVIISICHFKQLQTPTNFLLLSLAMADFLVGVIVMPLYFTMLIDPRGCFGTLGCTLQIAAVYLTCVSIHNVALIAVDRCFAICNPFQYSMQMTVNVTLRIISILWSSSLIYNIVYLHFNAKMPYMEENVTCAECADQIDEIWSIVDCIFVFIVPCLIIVIMYLKISSIASSHAKKIRSVQNCTKTNNASTKSERKAAKALGVLVSVFLLCLVPFYICAFLEAYISNKYIHIAFRNSMTLLYINSAINPIIYALLYPWFQRSFKLILTGRICRAGSCLQLGL